MRSTRALLLISAGLFVAACTSTEATPPPRTDPTATTPTSSVVATSSVSTELAPSSSVSTSDDEIADAYLDALEAEDAAAEISDPQFPALGATHLDPLLADLQERMRGRLALGQFTRQPEGSPSGSTVEAVVVAGSSAEVTECRVDAGEVYEQATGRVLNNSVVTQRRVATLQLDGEVWKVSNRTNEVEWEGVAGCAA